MGNFLIKPTPPTPPNKRVLCLLGCGVNLCGPVLLFSDNKGPKAIFLSSPSVYTRGFGVFDHPNIKSSHTFLVILYSDRQRPFRNRFCRPKRATKCAMYTFTSMRMIWCVLDAHREKKK